MKKSVKAIASVSAIILGLLVAGCESTKQSAPATKPAEGPEKSVVATDAVVVDAVEAPEAAE